MDGFKEKSYGPEDRSVFLKEIVINSAQRRAQIEKYTRGQNKCDKWFSVRRGKLTASTFGRALKCRGNWINFMKPCTFTNDAMLWGLNNEQKAIELYEIAMETTVNKAGFFVHPSGALGGSPDGLVPSACKIVEVKCPYSKRDCADLNRVVDSGGFYIKRGQKGELYLDLAHDQGWSYWHQIQGCMQLVQWATSCDLVIWTPKDLLVLNVPRDPTWEKLYLPRLLRIWLKHWVPHILECHVPMVSYNVQFILHFVHICVIAHTHCHVEV